MLGSAVNDTIREQMAAVKREYNRSHVTISSTGSANAYVLTYTTAPPAYVHGMRFAFKANFANTGAATVNVNSLGAKSIVRVNGSTALAANDIVSDQHVHLEYDSALDKLVMLTVPGTTATTGANTFTADQTITSGAINTARATVASAATTADIWAADGNQIDWTGTTTCTGFPAAPQAGVERVLICAAAAPFTAGANMLIDGVTSGNTVTCAANDIMIVRAVTTTQFRLSRVKYDGKPQVGLGVAPTVQIFTSSGTYTKPAGLVAAIVEVCGGGGGGGGAADGSYTKGGGGGGGSSTRRRLLASQIGATETVTIGAAGAAGVAAGGGNGGNGGTSSFGTLVDAPGGAGGVGGSAANTPYVGGAGGAAGSAGDVFFRGSSGLMSDANGTAVGASGGGGASQYGGGALPIVNTLGAGNPGLIYGGGGSGGLGQAGSPSAGGAGAAGIVIVTEYY